MLPSNLLTHTVSVTRLSDQITTSDGVILSYATTTSYSQEVTVEIQVASADVVTFSIVGLLNGVTQNSTVAFTGNGIYILESDESYDTITSITSDVAPTTCTIKARYLSGQYATSDSEIYARLRGRLDYVKGGSLSFLQTGLSVQDKRILYSDAQEGAIQVNDIVTSDTTRYRVIGLDIVYGLDSYHHTEILLELI